MFNHLSREVGEEWKKRRREVRYLQKMQKDHFANDGRSNHDQWSGRHELSDQTTSQARLLVRWQVPCLIIIVSV